MQRNVAGVTKTHNAMAQAKHLAQVFIPSGGDDDLACTLCGEPDSKRQTKSSQTTRYEVTPFWLGSEDRLHLHETSRV